MLTITLLAALLSLLLTLATLWINPHRFSNQAFALTTLVQTIWLGCVYRAIEAGNSLNASRNDDLEFWFRANAAVVSILPACIWLVKNAILSNQYERNFSICNTLPIFALSVFSAILCFTDSFISQNNAHVFIRGLPYYLFIFISTSVYLLSTIRILKEINKNAGIRRVELQFLGLNAGGVALLLAGC
jgi:hypothetical protein